MSLCRFHRPPPLPPPLPKRAIWMTVGKSNEVHRSLRRNRRFQWNRVRKKQQPEPLGPSAPLARPWLPWLLADFPPSRNCFGVTHLRRPIRTRHRRRLHPSISLESLIFIDLTYEINHNLFGMFVLLLVRRVPPELQGVSVKDLVRVRESRANGNASPPPSPNVSRKSPVVKAPRSASVSAAKYSEPISPVGG